MGKLLRNLGKREIGLALLSVLFVIVQVKLDLTVPDYMKHITELIQTEGSQMAEILQTGGKMLLCALGSLVAAMLTAVCAARVASNFSAVVRLKLFDSVQGFSMEEIGRFSTASLITRSTNDVTQVQMLVVMGIAVLFRAPVMAIMALTKIAGKSWQWSMSTGVAVLIIFAIMAICVCLTMPRFKRLQGQTDEVNRVTRENLTGLRVVRAYNAEAYQEEKFEQANVNLTNTHLFTSRTMSFMMPSIQAVMSGLTLAIYWVGAYLINNAGMAEKMNLFSDMVVFSQYAMQIVMAFLMLVMIFILLPRASVAAKRIQEVLDTQPSIHDGSLTETDPAHAGEIEFRNVSFRYPGADGDMLEDISFSVKKGETVAIIGSTGCGKSTLINLVPRFYDVTQGEVLVDGVDVRKYRQETLRSKIGYISQKATLFTGDIRSNIAFGDNDNAEETVKQALEVAQAGEFVDKLPEGDKAFVAQGGSNYSGGQKQRISIARAICRKPEILIFDDSFSALDYKTDRKLRGALNAVCGDVTRLIVAQRIGTIRDADKIIVLADGKIAGMGTHRELMDSCEVYQEIAYSQLSKEELA